jgi:predicted nucleic acid-binding protein
MIRVYIDTSVVGGCFDDEFSEASQALFEMAGRGEISLLISNILVDELTLAPERVQKVVADLPAGSFEIIQESEASRQLRDKYLDAGVVGAPHVNDAHHVAIATVSAADMIVSWNFKHLVHYDKIRQFNEVNVAAGYPAIQIFCPLEVI